MNSPIFSAARIAALEKHLLSREDLHALMEADADGALRILHDKGYGGENAAATDAEELISGELAKVRELICELSSDTALTDAFFLRADIINLKMLIKMRLQGKKLELDVPAQGGLYEPKLLALMTKEWDFSELPIIIADALKDLDEQLAVRKNPQLVSVLLDKCYYTYVRSIGGFAEVYFGTECDFVNLLTLLRMKDADLSHKEFEQLLMPPYKLPIEVISEAFIKKEINAKVILANADENMRKAAAASLEGGNARELEKARDNLLLGLARKEKSNMETAMPVVWYYITKKRESEIVRLIITLKRSGTEKKRIEERLRELYG